MNNCRVKFYIRSDNYNKAMYVYKLCILVLVACGISSIVLETLKMRMIASITELGLLCSVAGIIAFGVMRYRVLELRYIANDDIIKVIDNKDVIAIQNIEYKDAVLNIKDKQYILYDEEDENKLLTFKEQVRNIRGYEEGDLVDDSTM